MKICFITPYLPNLSSGSAVRSYHLLKQLSKYHDVTLVSALSESDISLSEFKEKVHKKTFCFTIPNINLNTRIKYYMENKIPYVERLRNSNFSSVLKHIPKDTDIIHISELQAYSLIELHIDQLPGKKILDAHNVDYLRLKSELDSSSILRKYAGYHLINKLKQYEIDAIQRIDHLLVCSEEDKKIFSQYKNEKKIIVIPNGVDLSSFKARKIHGEESTVLFMGNLSYSPNDYGLRWYIEKVHPIIKNKIPNYKFTIIGKDAPSWLMVKAKSDNNIDLKGFVKSVQNEITKAQICICPIFSGSGTRLKLLEYMAMSKAVISTTQGAEGIKIINKKNLLIENTVEGFVNSIKVLSTNYQLRNELGSNALVLIRKYYSWEHIGRLLNSNYSRTV